MLDKDARKGCIKIEYNDQDLSVSLTVDTQDDLSVPRLMGAIGEQFMDIGLDDILEFKLFVESR